VYEHGNMWEHMTHGAHDGCCPFGTVQTQGDWHVQVCLPFSLLLPALEAVAVVQPTVGVGSWGASSKPRTRQPAQTMEASDGDPLPIEAEFNAARRALLQAVQRHVVYRPLVDAPTTVAVEGVSASDQERGGAAARLAWKGAGSWDVELRARLACAQRLSAAGCLSKPLAIKYD
jgi:hypothetical protein